MTIKPAGSQEGGDQAPALPLPNYYSVLGGEYRRPTRAVFDSYAVPGRSPQLQAALTVLETTGVIKPYSDIEAGYQQVQAQLKEVEDVIAVEELSRQTDELDMARLVRDMAVSDMALAELFVGELLESGIGTFRIERVTQPLAVAPAYRAMDSLEKRDLIGMRARMWGRQMLNVRVAVERNLLQADEVSLYNQTWERAVS